MALTGGLNRLDLKPLNERGELSSNVRGSHRGPAEGLNVHNPQPGFVYKWIRHPRFDRAGAQFRRFINMGYEVCGPDSPERRAESSNMHLSKLGGLDNYQTHGDVVLLRIPESKYRELQEFREHQRKVALDGVTDGFLSRGKDIEQRLGSPASSARPIYYRKAEHGEVS